MSEITCLRRFRSIVNYIDIFSSSGGNLSEIFPSTQPEEPTKKRFISFVSDKILGNFNFLERLIFGSIFIVLGFFLGTYGD